MSDAVRAHARYEAFASGFLLPLLRGGPTVVDRALGPGLLQHFALARPSDPELDAALYDALHAAASTVAPVRRLPYPDEGTMALAMAAHDLLLLTDPTLDRAIARTARPTILGWVDALLRAAGPARTRGQALARHPIVDRVCSLRREDVEVKTWVSSYRFAGRPPPWNVVAAPRLRRVRQERVRRPIYALFDALAARTHLDVSARVRALLGRSPLTHLLRLGEANAPALGASALGLLADPSVRGGVARAFADRGFASSAELLGSALSDLHSREAPPPLMAALLSLCLELAQLDALEADRPAAAAIAGDGPGLALFTAVVSALIDAPGALAPLLALPPGDAARFDAWRDAATGRDRPELLDRARTLIAQACAAPAPAPAPEARP